MCAVGCACRGSHRCCMRVCIDVEVGRGVGCVERSNGGFEREEDVDLHADPRVDLYV